MYSQVSPLGLGAGTSSGTAHSPYVPATAGQNDCRWRPIRHLALASSREVVAGDSSPYAEGVNGNDVLSIWNLPRLIAAHLLSLTRGWLGTGTHDGASADLTGTADVDRDHAGLVTGLEQRVAVLSPSGGVVVGAVENRVTHDTQVKRHGVATDERTRGIDHVVERERPVGG